MAIFELDPKKPNSDRRALIARPRRLRQSETLRAMVRETELNARDFIYPLFVRHGQGRTPIASMPGVSQLSVLEAVREAETAAKLGIPAVILFGIPAEKDPLGLENFAQDGVVQQAIRLIKREVPEMLVVTDVCLCEYTDHGHCGILNTGEHFQASLPEGYVLNDPTLNVLGKVAVSHAACGADIVAPSGMLDGMVIAIREALDVNGFENVPILSYAIKYASAFYGPFRDAAEGAPKFGDRKSHQMDPANIREALREAALDVDEGADMLMVKPALAYLDVIRSVKNAFPEIPMAAYNVSGEYAMIKAAAANGWIDESRVTLETLLAMKRAGADLIITYHALDAARWLN
ncbi:MAG TPA: porphobilinogen synthase [Anaerolineae bacterium]|nr:porphobilinogen synthase [Anaerolineae bacterium]HCC78317.1 porphobilinogen synthase [Anaerolineae bacterium]HCM97694.1 porphobilinogen synthase [Anaerolineae bacterium]